MLASEEFGSTLFHNTIVDDVEEENPCEDQIRADLDKVLDDDIDDADDWEQDENLAPNTSNHSNSASNHSNTASNHSNPPSNYSNSHTNKSNNTNNNQENNRQANRANSKEVYTHANNILNQSGLRHAYQHNGGQWPLQPTHPYLKNYPLPPPGLYQASPYPPYPYPPPSNYEQQGFESRDTFDSRDSSDITGNNADQISQLSRDDYYPVGADKTEWDSQCDSPGNQLNSDVFAGDVEHQPEQLNALYRANQRKLDQITTQLQETQDTYTKQIHQLQHKVGLLQSEKSILETQLSQSSLRMKELVGEVEREKQAKDKTSKTLEDLNEQTISLELRLQESSSEINRLSYQLKDSVPKKQSEYCEGMLDKAYKMHEQQITEAKKNLDTAKRDIVNKDLEIEKLKVELNNSVKNKVTTLEADLQAKEDGLKDALEELLITLPKINMIDISLPLVTEVQSSTLPELTSHLQMMTSRLCDSEVTPRTLSSTITDLTNECDILRHTAAQLQSRVAQSEQTEEEAVSRCEAKARAISYMEGEVDRLTLQLKEMRETVQQAEQRESNAVSRERGVTEKLAEAEQRCEQTLIDQTNTLKRMRASEETSRLEKHGLENKVEEHRLQITALQEEIDKGKDLYVTLSKEKDDLRKDHEKRLENFQQKASGEMVSQLREIKNKCDEETEELLIRKEEDMLSSFEEEKESLKSELTSRLSEQFEKRLQSELENSEKQWSGSTNVSSLCILEMTHRGIQTDQVLDSLSEAHFSKIWQVERASELSLARETAVALARAGWEKEKEKTIRNRVDIIVRSKKDEWVSEASKANEKEVEDLKYQLKQAVSRTEDIRRKVEAEYKETLFRTNEDYKTQMNKLLRTEREKSAVSEKRLVGVRKELNECREEISRARADNSMYMQSEVKYKLEVDKLTAMFEQLKCTEQSLLDRTETHSREMEVLSHKLEEALQKEAVVRTHCETVVGQMKEELVKYAESANNQAMEYVERAVSQCKDTTASKYKKYYQRLLYCLIEKHPNVKESVKHLQQTLPKQVARTPVYSPRHKPVELDVLTQRSTDSGLPSTQRSADSGISADSVLTTSHRNSTQDTPMVNSPNRQYGSPNLFRSSLSSPRSKRQYTPPHVSNNHTNLDSFSARRKLEMESHKV